MLRKWRAKEKLQKLGSGFFGSLPSRSPAYETWWSCGVVELGVRQKVQPRTKTVQFSSIHTNRGSFDGKYFDASENYSSRAIIECGVNTWEKKKIFTQLYLNQQSISLPITLHFGEHVSKARRWEQPVNKFCLYIFCARETSLMCHHRLDFMWTFFKTRSWGSLNRNLFPYLIIAIAFVTGARVSLASRLKVRVFAWGFW